MTLPQPKALNAEGKSALDVEEIMVIDSRVVVIPYVTACDLYKIAFEAAGLSEKDLASRRILGKAISAAEAAPLNADKERGE